MQTHLEHFWVLDKEKVDRLTQDYWYDRDTNPNNAAVTIYGKTYLPNRKNELRNYIFTEKYLNKLNEFLSEFNAKTYLSRTNYFPATPDGDYNTGYYNLVSSPRIGMSFKLKIERGGGASKTLYLILEGGRTQEVPNDVFLQNFEKYKSIISDFLRNPDKVFLSSKQKTIAALTATKKLGLDTAATKGITDKITGFLGSPSVPKNLTEQKLEGWVNGKSDNKHIEINITNDFVKKTTDVKEGSLPDGSFGKYRVFKKQYLDILSSIFKKNNLVNKYTEKTYQPINIPPPEYKGEIDELIQSGVSPHKLHIYITAKPEEIDKYSILASSIANEFVNEVVNNPFGGRNRKKTRKHRSRKLKKTRKH